MGHAQERLGPCASGFVQEWPHQPQVTLAAYRPVDAPGEVVQLGWLGHSSFLLTSPMGLRLLTDPNPLYPLPVAPEVVTISNLHDTHTGISSIPGQPQLLWGLTPEGAWNQIATTIRDVALFNVPSYASRIEPEQSPVQNSIFIFRMGRLCIAHLGNLRHPLTPGNCNTSASRMSSWCRQMASGR